MVDYIVFATPMRDLVNLEQIFLEEITWFYGKNQCDAKPFKIDKNSEAIAKELIESEVYQNQFKSGFECRDNPLLQIFLDSLVDHNCLTEEQVKNFRRTPNGIPNHHMEGTQNNL